MAETPLQREHQAHSQSPSAKFAAFHKAIDEHVVKTADERAAKDREEQHRTVYYADELIKDKG